MTQDKIIEMARQAGSIDSEDVILTVYNAFTSVEREACAKLCEQGIANADDWNSSYWDQACENRAWAIRARGQA
jgi:hypothetical protein